MFSKKSIPFYDHIYSSQGKDYSAEVSYLMKVVSRYGLSSKATLLDVACGTGRHLQILKRYFRAEGLDISLDFLCLAKNANPSTSFHKGDMRTFALGRKFDLITCMFSSIGYMKTMKDIKAAIRNMAAHLTDGGLLLVEPWLSPDQWHPGRVSMSIVNEPELKIVRMNTTERKGRMASFEMHYLVGKPGGVFHFAELHQTRLSSAQEMTNAFRKAGLDVEYDKKGPTGRGLYIAKVPSTKGRAHRRAV